MTVRVTVSTICAVALLLASPGTNAMAQDAKSPVAIVAGLHGAASVAAAAGTRPTPLSLFQWLDAGSVVNVAPRSRLMLVFSDGARYELRETARVIVGAKALASSRGHVVRLEPLPRFPRLQPIAESASPGERSAAVRIRGGTIAGLYPARGATTLADATVLRFTPVTDASRYEVAVEAADGTTLFDGESRSPTVIVPPGVLQPGARYYWRVRTLDRIGEVAGSSAAFVTLDAENARARAMLDTSLRDAADASSLALLAEIDRTLGLLEEARARFGAAVARAPDDVAIRQALARLERQLAADGGPPNN